jgi:DHA2 family multidrug resistance protein
VATLATFMEVLDTSIANVALPHIAGNLGGTSEDSTWILTSYLVANAVVLPASAWFSALFGRKRFYMACVALFTISSLLCGLAPSLGMLVLFRLLQGLGGGGLQPSTQAILVDTFPPHQRGMGMAVYGMTVVAAPVIGPTLGGWITDNFSWRWIFFINIPIGLISLALTSSIISDPPYITRRSRSARIDGIGLGLIAVGIGALQLVLDLGERHDWFASHFIAVTAIVAAACLGLAVAWELSHPDPVVDLRMLRDRNVALACLTMLVFGFVLFGSTVLLPLFMQTLLGWNATTSGMAVSPGGLVIMVMMPLIGWLVSRFDARWMITLGTAIIVWSIWGMGGFSLAVDFRTIVWWRMLQGLGLSFIFVPINTLAYAHVARHQRNAASSLVSLARNVGASVGIAMVATMIGRGAQAHRTGLVAHLTPTAPLYAERRDSMAARTAPGPDGAARADAAIDRALQQQAQAASYVDEFRGLAVWFALLLPLVLLMRPPKRGAAEAPAATAEH